MNPTTLSVPPTAPELTDAELVARIRAGDEDAAEYLVRRHYQRVYAVTYRMLGDREQALDAAQDALVGALRALPSWRGDAALQHWLLRIAVNAARTIARRRTRRREVSIDYASQRATDEPAADGVVALKEEASRAERMLALVPEKQRMAITLRIQHGMSYAEVAAALGCSEGAARVNYHLGIKRLRELAK